MLLGCTQFPIHPRWKSNRVLFDLEVSYGDVTTNYVAAQSAASQGIINYELFIVLAIASMPLAENVIFAIGVRRHVE